MILRAQPLNFSFQESLNLALLISISEIQLFIHLLRNINCLLFRKTENDTRKQTLLCNCANCICELFEIILRSLRIWPISTLSTLVFNGVMSNLFKGILFRLQRFLLKINLFFLLILSLLFSSLCLLLLGLIILCILGLGILLMHGEDLLDCVSLDHAELVLNQVKRVLVDDEVLQGHRTLLCHLHVNLLLLGTADPVCELTIVRDCCRQHHHLDMIWQLHDNLLPH